MATSKERALEYFNRLLKANNPKLELQKIYTDLNNLIYTASKKPIDRSTKVEILEELEHLIRQTPSLEERHNYGTYDSIRGTTASDNSDILDVISAMKKRAE
ncbi:MULTISPECIES: hypothetical protein [unclassified Pseudomonas]|jgi:hypothetical protein|uniref:hypothetical protein n=1 Tax=unclassified Pseudomonas TaxID=196821 RepID=UPI00075E4991|nr:MULTISPECIES: hypothetical protein [unclassified Pseudomonas]KVV03102.1 hypothetical protein AP060_02777 [Pseudomonas sp. TAD18]KVV05464.1 hypothetical protein AP059_02760 [Pseudomonas sp. TAA207]